MRNDKFFAVIPAAGKSQRMLQHKLLLPWHGKLVIDQILQTWTASKVDEIVILVRHDDQPLIDECKKWPVVIHQLKSETADMKESIQHGLKQIESLFRPNDSDHCLIAPADLPRLKTEVIDQVINTASETEQIVAPYFGEKRGHPVCIPWHKTGVIFDLATDEGLNSFIDRSKFKRVQFPEEKRARDIDTPTDYQREIKALEDLDL